MNNMMVIYILQLLRYRMQNSTTIEKLIVSNLSCEQLTNVYLLNTTGTQQLILR